MLRKKSTLLLYLYFILLVVLTSSCSVNKFLPEDKTLFTGAEIEVNTEEDKEISELKSKLNSAIERNTNSKFLGMRPGLYYHFKAQRENPGFINKFLNKQIGEDPYYFESFDIDADENILTNRLQNSGYFGSKVTSTVERDSTDRSTSVKYSIDLVKPYRLKSYSLQKTLEDTLTIYKDIQSSLQSSIIKENGLFDLTQLKAERDRIDLYLKQRGYYNFNSDFLIFEADTNRYDQRSFDLFLRLKTKVPKKSLVPYVVDEVNIYPNRSLSSETEIKDTTNYMGYNFIQDSVFFKPKRLEPYILIEPDKAYNPKTSKYTSRRLSSIQTYKFVNINYTETDTVEDNVGNRHLKADIYLSPLNKRSLRLELQAVTKSNNFSGPNLSVVYSNRNLFKGGELLRLSASGGYEQQFFGKTDDQGLSSIQLGLNASILFPRLIFPIDLSESFEYAIPKTKVSLSLDHLNRTQLYTLNSVSSSFGYLWEGNTYVTHELRPINIQYVSLGKTSDEFDQILDENPFLRRSFDQQFIAGLTYNFTYDEIVDQSKSGGLYFGANYDMAGNGLNFLGSENEQGKNTFLGLEYAHYIKADLELRYHLKLDNDRQKLVGRIFGGVGQPLGTTQSLPFVKQFFSGGPYSVRAFRIRSLGPGTYSPEDGSNSFFDQSGDIKLEANLEYRFPITEYLNGAFFADAGNVWLMQENEALPGGRFSSSFINELGAGVGFGLRVDIQGFVIRLDLASPIKEPTASWNFDASSPVLNFAIGYPF
ncbi:bacteria surface antigen superfamily protein [Psychroflexus gondwanensis ACAM 44]|uniref:Bacteria surface antigen superfamily protein n=1 Tax=Psychroflexus gondwanensis ACAM 44 TaxID=1189619 RepID=N1X2L5_9FLAO|nr:BamA/TamA family outer membrane protein [Psychroflexus gondwanensis]EMY82303.1 bacteria surface antigen superfamily protein [Psychroflexus gondwanensis ACAM 44]